MALGGACRSPALNRQRIRPAPIFGAGVKLRSSSEMPGYAVAMITAESVAIHDISFLEEHTTFENAREFGGRDKPSV